LYFGLTELVINLLVAELFIWNPNHITTLNYLSLLRFG
jgi:hypothetical protein